MSDFVKSFENVLILQYKNGMLVKKLATRFLPQTFFLQELYQKERIQQIPVDLGILEHSVPS